MNVFIIHSSGQQIGPFPPETVYELLDNGQITGDDLAWMEPMPEWRPLSELLPQEESQPSPAPVPVAPVPVAPLKEADPAASGLPVVVRPITRFNRPRAATPAAAVDPTAPVAPPPPVPPPKKVGLRPIPPMKLTPHWQPPPETEDAPLFPDEQPAEPSTRRTVGLAVTILIFLGLLGAAALYKIREHRLRPRAAETSSSLFTQGEAPAEPLSAADIEQRDKAAAELRGKILTLPSKTSTTSNIFYHDFRVTFGQTRFAFVPWAATIRGVEDILDPATRKTEWRTEFTLVTVYHSGEWTFQSYRASTTYVVDEVKPSESAGLSWPTV